jgi:uncharacterized protein YegP (UPF0339 family)
MPPYFFWVYRDAATEWRWTLWAWGNRKKLCASGEGFSSLQSCERNIALVRSVVPSAPVEYHESAR